MARSALDLDEETVHAVLERAGRAPSLHNSQPWRWRWNGRRAALYLDPSRLLPVTDAFHRQGMLACGVVLDHAVVAFTAAGWPPRVDRFPEPADRSHLASLVFGEQRAPTQAELALAAAIDHRYSDRAPFAALARWVDLRPVLESACREHATTMSVVGGTVRRELDHLSWTTAALRQRDSRYQLEARWWIGGRAPESGVPAGALPSPRIAERVPINREFPGGTADPGVAEHDAAYLMLLCTADDTAQSLLTCGEALSELLLECTRHEVGTCVLTHLLEMPETRAQVEALTATSHPQAFVRAGGATAPRPARTPRRPVGSVLEID